MDHHLQEPSGRGAFVSLRETVLGVLHDFQDPAILAPDDRAADLWRRNETDDMALTPVLLVIIGRGSR